MYDLMDKMTAISATASRQAIRQAAGNLFVRFLLFYPMGEKRLDHHIRQVNTYF